MTQRSSLHSLCQSWEPGPQWSGATLAYERDAARILHLPRKSSRSRVETETRPVGSGGVVDVPTQLPRTERRLSAGESLTVGPEWECTRSRGWGGNWEEGLQAWGQHVQRSGLENLLFLPDIVCCFLNYSPILVLGCIPHPHPNDLLF